MRIRKPAAGARGPGSSRTASRRSSMSRPTRISEMSGSIWRPGATTLRRRGRRLGPAVGCAYSSSTSSDRASGRGLCDRSEAESRLQPWRDLRPRSLLTDEVVSVVEEGPHVGGIELFLVLELEVATDVGQVEIEAVALRGQVDPVEITEALRVDERLDGASRNADSLPLDYRRGGGRNRGVPNDVDATRATHI